MVQGVILKKAYDGAIVSSLSEVLGLLETSRIRLMEINENSLKL